jgi:hypothetical protein
MRPTTLTVGPLAAASANLIALSQTVAAGKIFVFSASAAAFSFAGTGSIAGNVWTVTAVIGGVVSIGDVIYGTGIAPNTKIIGVGPGTTNGVGTYVLSTSNTVASSLMYLNQSVTLDTPRRVLITPAGNESANSFTIVGTGYNNDPLTEVVAGGNATATYSAMDFRTITQVYAANATAAAATIGTNGIASSRWFRFDDFAFAPNAVQTVVTGTANYTIEDNLQNSEPALDPSRLTWLGAGIVGGSTSSITPFTYAPMWRRVTLNSGSGSVSATILQSSNTPF